MLYEFPRFHAGDEQTTGGLSAPLIAAIPEHTVATGVELAVNQGAHQLTVDVVNAQPDLGSSRQIKLNRGARVERIRIILKKHEGFGEIRCERLINAGGRRGNRVHIE